MTAALVAGCAAALVVGLARRPAPRVLARAGSLPPWRVVAVPLVFVVAVAGVRWPIVWIGLAGSLGVLALWRRGRRRRLAHAASLRVLETCELVAAELAAGRTLPDVLAEAVRAWPDLGPVAEAQALGLDPAAALTALGERPGCAGLRLLGAGWQVATRSGLGLAEVSHAIADDLRAEVTTARLIQSELASARSTAWLLAALPAVAILMGSGSGGDPLGFLVGSAAGLACLAVGLVLQFVGLWWIDVLAGGAS